MYPVRVTVYDMAQVFANVAARSWTRREIAEELGIDAESVHLIEYACERLSPRPAPLDPSKKPHAYGACETVRILDSLIETQRDPRFASDQKTLRRARLVRDKLAPIAEDERQDDLFCAAIEYAGELRAEIGREILKGHADEIRARIEEALAARFKGLLPDPLIADAARTEEQSEAHRADLRRKVDAATESYVRILLPWDEARRERFAARFFNENRRADIRRRLAQAEGRPLYRGHNRLTAGGE